MIGIQKMILFKSPKVYMKNKHINEPSYGHPRPFVRNRLDNAEIDCIVLYVLDCLFSMPD